MNNRIPRTERDHVLLDVKAKPSGWPTANLDPDSGRGPRATSGTPAPEESTISGLYGIRGLPPSEWARIYSKSVASRSSRTTLRLVTLCRLAPRAAM